MFYQSKFILLLLLLISFTVTCSEYPTETEWSNPIDPANPITNGDPYNIRASHIESGISLEWDSVGLPQLAGYNLYRRVDDDGFIRFQQTTANTTSHIDTTVADGHQYEYYVLAVNSRGEVERTDTTSATIRSNPFMVIEGDSSYTPTINVELTILAFGAEMMLLSNSADFAGASWDTVTSTKHWSLETGAGIKSVYIRIAYPEGDSSTIVSDQIEPAVLNPTIVINDGDTHTATRSVQLLLSSVGATEMQLSNEPIQDDESWQAYSDTANWELKNGAGIKTVYGKFRNDFLIEADATCQINSSELNPTIVINVGDTHTPTRSVRLSLSADGAIEMQLSNEPFQGDESWEPFSEAVDWELMTGAGVKSVFARVRNDFLIEAEASDQIEPAALNPELNIEEEFTNQTAVSVLIPPSVGAIEMKIANVPDSSLVNWQPYSESLDWSIPPGDGWKRVYGWFKNDFYVADEMVVDSIGLDTRAVIESFNWSGSGGDTLRMDDQLMLNLRVVDDAFGAETGGRVEVTVEGWDPILLTDQGNGLYNGIITFTRDYAEVTDAQVSVIFVDRSGNQLNELTADRRLTTRHPVILAYVADHESGLRVVNISDFENPWEVGYCDTPEDARAVTVSGDYAYLADGTLRRLYVIDISNPENPVIVGNCSTEDFANGVAVSGDNAYLLDSRGGLRIVNISNPENPVEVGRYSTMYFVPDDIVVSGGYAYIADGKSRETYGGLHVINISNPENPVREGWYESNGSVRGVAVSGDYAYIGFNGLSVIDISNPYNPVIVGNYESPANAECVALSGDYAYVAADRDGLYVIDISNPENPIGVGNYDTPGRANNVTISGNYAYVADEDGGLRFIDISDPGNPNEVGNYDTPGDALDVDVVEYR